MITGRVKAFGVAVTSSGHSLGYMCRVWIRFDGLTTSETTDYGPMSATELCDLLCTIADEYRPGSVVTVEGTQLSLDELA